MTISQEQLHSKIMQILIHQGISSSDASITAQILIEGNLRGYPHHGIDRIFQILEGLKYQTINPNVTPTLLVDLPAIAVFDGNYGLGQPLGKMAMELAIKKAKNVGIGTVGILNASHLGILAFYSEIASLQGCLGIVLSTSSPAVVIKGGKKKTFGTNPISYSIPYSPYPVTADFATSKVSRGTIFDYVEKKLPIPLGWAVDEDGNDTTDPQKALKGGIKTIDGNIKGSLLSLLVSIMAGPLIGGVNNIKVTGTRYMDQKPNKGDLFMAFNINHITSSMKFEKSIAELLDFIEEQKVEFQIPGKYDHLFKEKTKNNILLSEKFQELLLRCNHMDNQWTI